MNKNDNTLQEIGTDVNKVTLGAMVFLFVLVLGVIVFPFYKMFF